MTSYTKDDTIFVQIASYRDPELQHTLQDLFKKAKRPENIFVGICHQYDMKGDEDKHLFEVPFPRQDQLRIFERDYRESKTGMCWSRNKAQEFWRGEKWTLQIDSHMRFVEGWDKILVETIKGQNNKVVLSSYVYAYTRGDKDGRDAVKYTSTTACHEVCGTIRMCGGIVLTLDKPILGAFLTGHFCFLDSQIFRKFIWDPFIYMVGDEVNMSMRLWTSGYDIMVPDKPTIGHLYVSEASKSMGYRKIQSADHADPSALSYARIAHLFNTKKSNDSKVLEDIEKYWIGNHRTLRDFERYSGADFKKLKARGRAKLGILEKWHEVSKISDIKELFKKSELTN